MLLCPLTTPQHCTVTVLLPTIFTTPMDNRYELGKSPWKTVFEPLHGIRENWRSQLSVSSIATTKGFCHERSTEWSNRMARLGKVWHILGNASRQGFLLWQIMWDSNCSQTYHQSNQDHPRFLSKCHFRPREVNKAGREEYHWKWTWRICDKSQLSNCAGVSLGEIKGYSGTNSQSTHSREEKDWALA